MTAHKGKIAAAAIAHRENGWREKFSPATNALWDELSKREDDVSVQNAIDAIRAGADVNAANPLGVTILMKAVSAGKIEIISSLMAHDVRLDDVSTMFGESAIFRTINIDAKCALLPRLIELGADIALRNLRGETLLMRAAKSRCPDAVAHLLKARVNPNDRDKSGKTALMHALGDEINGWQTETIDALLDGHANVNLTSNAGDSALMLAAGAGDIWGVMRLLKAEAKVDAVNEKGETALLRAASAGSEDCLRALLFAQADPTVCDRRGRGISHYLLKRKKAAGFSADIFSIIDDCAAPFLEQKRLRLAEHVREAGVVVLQSPVSLPAVLRPRKRGLAP